MNSHLSDKALQDLVLSKEDALLHPHLSGCEACRLKLQHYQTLFAALAEHELADAPVGFADLVMDQIPVAPVVASTRPVFVLTALLAGIAAVVGYRLLPASVWSYVQGQQYIGIGLLGVGAVLVLGFFMVTQWKHYQHQINLINRSGFLQPDE